MLSIHYEMSPKLFVTPNVVCSVYKLHDQDKSLDIVIDATQGIICSMIFYTFQIFTPNKHIGNECIKSIVLFVLPGMWS